MSVNSGESCFCVVAEDDVCCQPDAVSLYQAGPESLIFNAF